MAFMTDGIWDGALDFRVVDTRSQIPAPSDPLFPDGPQPK